MDVVHVYDGHERVYGGDGSVPTVVWNYATQTADRGHDVTVVERQWAGTDERSEHERVSFHRLSLRTGSDTPWDRIPYELVTSPAGTAKLGIDRTNFALSALRELRDLRFDVIHVHLPFAANILVTIAPWLRDHLVYTAHIGSSQERIIDPGFSPDVHLAKRAGKTTVLNPRMKTAFESRGVDSHRLTVVPNGVDVARFRENPVTTARLNQEYALGDDRVVLFVSTINPRKGLEELIRATDRIIDHHDGDIQFVVVGKTEVDPEYTDRVRTIVEEKGLNDSVVFTGFIPDDRVTALYHRADVFVLPSLGEGFGMSVTEAMAAGTPVVGSRVGGIEQQIDHGVHGMLIPPGDIEALSDCIIQLLEEPKVRTRMGNAAKQRAEAFSWERVTRELLDVYREVGA